MESDRVHAVVDDKQATNIHNTGLQTYQTTSTEKKVLRMSVEIRKSDKMERRWLQGAAHSPSRQEAQAATFLTLLNVH